MKTIATQGCTAVLGIPIDEEDSQIVLAEHNSAIVFKYDHYEHDYLFFQNLKFNSSILGLSSILPTGS